MTKMLFCIVFLSTSISGAALDAETVDFKDGLFFLQVQKSRTSLRFLDKEGPRTLVIKECNRKKIEAFWSEIQETIRQILPANQRAVAATKEMAWVEYEKIKVLIPDDQSAIGYFHRLPFQSQILFVESIKECKK